MHEAFIAYVKHNADPELDLADLWALCNFKPYCECMNKGINQTWVNKEGESIIIKGSLHPDKSRRYQVEIHALTLRMELQKNGFKRKDEEKGSSDT